MLEIGQYTVPTFGLEADWMIWKTFHLKASNCRCSHNGCCGLQSFWQWGFKCLRFCVAFVAFQRFEIHKLEQSDNFIVLRRLIHVITLEKGCY